MTHQERKKIYLDYLRMKLEEGDYHGVADCAMDLRELEVEIRMSPTVTFSMTNELCAHMNTRITEPHLAGARKCLDCGMVYNPNRQPNWQFELDRNSL